MIFVLFLMASSTENDSMMMIQFLTVCFRSIWSFPTTARHEYGNNCLLAKSSSISFLNQCLVHFQHKRRHRRRQHDIWNWKITPLGWDCTMFSLDKSRCACPLLAFAGRWLNDNIPTIHTSYVWVFVCGIGTMRMEKTHRGHFKWSLQDILN